MRANTSTLSLWACLFSVLWLTACTHLASRNTGGDSEHNSTVYIMPLLPVPAFLEDHVWLEDFSFSLTKQDNEKLAAMAKQNMLLQTEFTATGINLAAMSYSGALLAQASWHKSKQSVTSEIGLAKGFNAKQVMHDLQVSHWPIQQIEAALLHGVKVNEQLTTQGRTRTFHLQDEVLITIHYNSQDNKVVFEQHRQGYQLTIQRLSNKSLTAPTK